MLNNNWFTWKINITCDTRLALITEATGALSKWKVPHLRHLLEWVLEAQANKWSQRISVLQMETQLEVEGKNDMGRPSVGEQGP